jgi:hypothetical protein
MSTHNPFNDPLYQPVPGVTPAQPGMIAKGKSFLGSRKGKIALGIGATAGAALSYKPIANMFGADVGGEKQSAADQAARIALASAPESYAGEADIMERSNSTMTDILRQRAGNPYQSELSDLMSQLNLTAIEQHALQSMQPQAPTTNPLESFLRQAGVWPD